MIFVTGGAGFIGANFVMDWLRQNDEHIVNIDTLTYAGNLESLSALQSDSRHIFIKGDIGDTALITELLEKYQPRAVLNFAAESHVDRSIHGPETFVQTNVVGTFHLLESVRTYWEKLKEGSKTNFRFLHVSTDEVYGSLNKGEPALSLFKIAVTCLRLLPRYRHWSTSMAERMNQDLIFDHEAATKEFCYKARKFAPEKKDLVEL